MTVFVHPPASEAKPNPSPGWPHPWLEPGLLLVKEVFEVTEDEHARVVDVEITHNANRVG